jgi:hypothetical protein
MHKHGNIGTKTPYRRRSPEEEERVRNLRRERPEADTVQLAAELHMPLSTVRAILKRWELPTRSDSRLRLRNSSLAKQLCALRAAHPEWPLRRLGEEAGVSYEHARKVLQACGRQTAKQQAQAQERKRPETQRAKRITEVFLRHPDWSAPAIAKDADTSVSHVYHVLKRAGFRLYGAQTRTCSRCKKTVASRQAVTRKLGRRSKPYYYCVSCTKALARKAHAFAIV